MEQGLKHIVSRMSMQLSITVLVLIAANVQAADVARQRTFSLPGCAWSECRSCGQYRSLCEPGDIGGGADMAILLAGTAGNARRDRDLGTSSASSSFVRDRDREERPAPPERSSKDSPFGPLEACGNFPGRLGGTNYTGSEVGPWIDVNRTNSDNIVAIWQQDRWSDGGSRGNVAGVSFDGGSSWRIVPIPGLTDCTGGPWERASDPWVSFGPDGTVYQMSLVFQTNDRVGEFGANAMVVSKSEDGGLNWSDPITLIEDDDPRILNHKNTLTADPTDASLVYAAWNRLEVTGIDDGAPESVRPAEGPAPDRRLRFKGPIYFARSTDGGRSWEPARKIYDPGAKARAIGNQIVVLPDGTVIDFFSERSSMGTGDPNGPGFNVFTLSLLRSTDKGETWSPSGRPIRAATIISRGAVTPDGGVPVRDASILFDIAVDRISGKLYATWQDTRFSGAEGIAFSMSSDGGFTWSEPIKVNQTPGRASNPLRSQAFLPSVAVVDNGVVAVTYYDFRNDIDAPGGELADYFAVHCESDCSRPANWGNEIRLTDTSFDFLQAPFAQGLFLGDYEGLASDGMNFLPAFGITSHADPASIIVRRFFIHP